MPRKNSGRKPRNIRGTVDMGKIRVARTITRLSGGPAFAAVLRARHMDPDRFETRLYYGKTEPGDPPEQLYLLDGAGVEATEVTELHRSIDPIRDLRALWRMVREFREFRPHIVHSHQSKDAYVARVAAVLAGVPVVIRTFHGHTYYREHFFGRHARLRQVYVALEIAGSPFIKTFTTLTPTIEQELVHTYRIGRHDEYFLIPTARDLMEFSSESTSRDMARRILGLPEDATVLATVASLTPRKLPVESLEAFNHFISMTSHPDPHLLYVGDGPLRSQLEERIRDLHLEDRVHLLGHRTDVPLIYRATDLSFINSTSEGTPGALIEALAAGVKVASVDVGGIRDLFDGNRLGTLAQPFSPLALAHAFEKELNTERDMESISKEILARYDVRSTTPRLEELYVRLLREEGFDV